VLLLSLVSSPPPHQCILHFDLQILNLWLGGFFGHNACMVSDSFGPNVQTRSTTQSRKKGGELWVLVKAMPWQWSHSHLSKDQKCVCLCVCVRACMLGFLNIFPTELTYQNDRIKDVFEIVLLKQFDIIFALCKSIPLVKRNDKVGCYNCLPTIWDKS
jgi:hypothetical protein